MGATRYLPDSSRRQFGASLLVYTALTAILGRDVLAGLGTTVANDPGDPLLTAAILHWNAQHIPWSDAWWQFPIFHPTRDTLAFSEHLLGLSALATPLAWLTGNALVTYNLITLLTFVLSAATMYLLVHRLSGSASGAFIAGLAFAFAPFRVSQMPHIQMLAAFWTPLALLGLHAFVDTGRRRWLALYAAAWPLQAAANGYALVFLSVLLSLWVLWFVVARAKWRELGFIAAATAAGALPLLPILARYVSVHATHGFSRGIEEIQGFSADAASVLCASPNVAVWGWLRVACRPEAELFPGLAVTVLLAVALLAATGVIWRTPVPAGPRLVVWPHRLLLIVAGTYGIVAASVMALGPWRLELGVLRASASSVSKPLFVAAGALLAAMLLSARLRMAIRQSSALVFYLLTALVTWLLALGPMIIVLGEATNRRGPYWWLMLLPGVDGLRAPGRFWMMTSVCLSIIGGLCVARILAGRSRTAAAAALVVLAPVIVADGWMTRIIAAPVPPAAPAPQVLAGQVVLELPLGGYYDIAAQWRGVTGGWTTVNGYSGYGPAYYPALTAATEIADDAALLPFQRDRELHVIVDSAYPGLIAFLERQPGVRRVARNQWATQYRLPKRPGAPAQAGARIPIAGLSTSCFRDEDPVEQAIDGDHTTRWVCPPNPRQELTIDLGSPATVGAFVQHLGAYSWEAPRTMIIETSLDGQSWTEVRRGSVLEAAIDGAQRVPLSPEVVVTFPPHQARYLRVRVENQITNFHFTMAEAEVRAPR